LPSIQGNNAAAPYFAIDNGNRGDHFRQPTFAVIGALTRKSFNTIGHLEDQMALERRAPEYHRVGFMRGDRPDIGPAGHRAGICS